MELRTSHMHLSLPDRSDSIDFFVAGLVLLPVYIKLMSVLSQLFAFSTTITTYAYYAVLWFFLLRGMIEKIRWQKKHTVIIIAVFFAIILFEILVHPSGIRYCFGGTLFEIVVFQPSVLIQSFLFIFVGMAVTDFGHLGSLMNKAARVGILGAFLTYALMLLTGIAIYEDDMSTAYSICLLLCVLVSYMEKKDWLIVLLGVICLVIAGTRGPILCFLMAVIFRFILFEQEPRKKVLGLISSIAVMVMVISDFMTALLHQLNNFLALFGVNQLRLLEYINAEKILNGSGREDFYSVLFKAIWEQPFLGYGFGGDRELLGGFYSHNIVLEILVSCGVILGGFIILWCIPNFLRMMTSSNAHTRKLGIALFCAIVIKLCLSATIIESKEFFLFLGLCIAARNNYKEFEDVAEM